MDTIETKEAPVGVEGATSSQDTASQVDTQPAETKPIVSDEKPVEADTALLAGKYKSPEELEKAYKELESKLGQRNEHSELVKMLEENTNMTASQIKDYIAQQKEQQLQAQYRANPELYTAQKIQQLESKLALQAEERELDKFLEKNPEYAPFREDIQEFAFLPKYQEKTYEEIARQKFGKAIAQGQQDAYKKIDTKQKTQATGTSRGEAKRSFTKEDLESMSVDELEKILPHSEAQNRPY